LSTDHSAKNLTGERTDVTYICEPRMTSKSEADMTTHLMPQSGNLSKII